MIQFNSSPAQEPSLLRMEPFRGMNLSVTPTQIDQSQSPEMVNFNIDERGALNKRTGYERLFQTSLGDGEINGLYEYKKTDGTSFFLIAHGTKLYTQKDNDQPVKVYDGLENTAVNFFTMNDKCYILDSLHYLVTDGISIKEVEPYVPLLSMSNEPTGGGTKHEDINLLGAAFKESFSTLGTTTEFQLSLTDLDSTPIFAEVGTDKKSETTDFTVDRKTGKVTFKTAPPKGTNNVTITAFKTHKDFPERIKKCRFHVLFGGSNDTRVFVAGNMDMPDYVWKSELFDPSYFPENGFYKFADTVVGFSKQYDYLVVERSGGKHQVTFSLDGDGYSTFPSKPINDQVGTIARGSIQLIDNNPVSLSERGVYMLTSSAVRDERNVTHISGRIDTKLLDELGLEKAISIDYEKKYWLALNGNVYVLDYGQRSEISPYGEWYIYDNIHASCFYELDGDLLFGSSKDGIVYRFKKATELYPYNDDGQPIRAKWISKVLSFGADERRKIVEKVFFSIKPYTHTSADLYYVSDKKSKKFIKTTRKDLFHYSYIDYGKFTYATRDFPQEAANKIKAKKIVYFQLLIENNEMDEPLGIASLAIKYNYQAYVK